MHVVAFLRLASLLLYIFAAAYAFWKEGLETASWVAGIFATFIMLVSILWPRFSNQDNGSTSSGGDLIVQRKIRARKNVIGKRSHDSSSRGDEIRQVDIEAQDGDVIGRENLPPG